MSSSRPPTPLASNEAAGPSSLPATCPRVRRTWATVLAPRVKRLENLGDAVHSQGGLAAPRGFRFPSGRVCRPAGGWETCGGGTQAEKEDRRLDRSSPGVVVRGGPPGRQPGRCPDTTHPRRVSLPVRRVVVRTARGGRCEPRRGGASGGMATARLLLLRRGGRLTAGREAAVVIGTTDRPGGRSVGTDRTRSSVSSVSASPSLPPRGDARRRRRRRW